MVLNFRASMYVLCASFFLIAIALALPATADLNVDRGIAIVKEAHQRDSGWGDSISDFTMILRNKHGHEVMRQLRTWVLEGKGDGDKSLIVFDDPKDVKGVAVLTYSHGENADDQWLYLPALKRVKRIAAKNRSGPFMGSEFAYNDLGSQELERYTYRFEREDTLNGIDCNVVERLPVVNKSGYARQLVWYDKEHYRLQQVEYYNRKNTLIKTLTATMYEQYNDKYWRAQVLQMENHQSGKSTEVKRGAFKFGNGLSERDFDPNSLARAR